MMLITFFSIKGIVHFEFIPQGQTVNQAYVGMLKLGLHHDSAPAHNMLSRNFWPKNLLVIWNTSLFP